MLATAFGLLSFLVGIWFLDHQGITQGSAASVGPILALPIVLLLSVGFYRFFQHHPLKHRHAHR